MALFEKLEQTLVLILAVPFLLLGALLAYGFFSAVQPLSTQEKHAAHGLDDGPIFKVKIGEQQFHFPREYVHFVATQGDKKIVRGQADVVWLGFVWPNIKTDAPITERLADDQSISLKIGHYPPGDLQQSDLHTQKMFFSDKWRRITPLEPWRLVEYEQPHTSWSSLSYVPSDESYTTPTGLKLRIICNRLRAEIAEGHRCLVRYPLMLGIRFNYEIRWSRLKEWREIDQFVRARTLSYMQTPS